MNEITEKMVEAAEAAVYQRHDRGFLLKPLVGAIDMRTALSAAIAAAEEQEPVVWRVRDYADGWIYSEKSPDAYSKETGAYFEPLYARPSPSGEAVEARRLALEAICDVAEMKTSAGADYFVRIRLGDRELTPHMFKDRWKAEYEVAEWQWLLNGADKPDLMAYGPNPISALTQKDKETKP